MALQAYPTKKEFLASDMEPVEHPDCAVCKEPMTEPVRLPCQGRHEYCKACITEWLQRPRNRSCPMCRQTLCHPKHKVADPPGLHGDSLAASRLETVAFGFAEGGLRRFAPGGILPKCLCPEVMDTFHDEIRWSEDHLQQLALPARMLLIGPFQKQADGTLLINAMALGSSLILMGNVVKNVAEYDNIFNESHKLWDQASSDLWAKMLLNIWQLLSPHDGVRLDIRPMFHAIMASLLDQAVYGDGGDVKCPFFTDHAQIGDLTYLVYFLLTHAGTRLSEPTVQPRALPRTASALAIHHADRLTKQAFRLLR
jgi:hypothetical protein